MQTIVAHGKGTPIKGRVPAPFLLKPCPRLNVPVTSRRLACLALPPARGTSYCYRGDFSSGKNGNIFDFLMLTEGVSFPEAVERLAQQAGIPQPVVTQERAARHCMRSPSLRPNSSKQRSLRAP